MNTEKQPLQIVDSLVYRLSDPFGTGVNVDEINVAMWEGHRNSAKRQLGARRVKACLDACEGIDTETLEVTHGLDAIYNHIQQQRDELLAALKDARSIFALAYDCAENGRNDECLLHTGIGGARSNTAIEKAEKP